MKSLCHRFITGRNHFAPDINKSEVVFFLVEEFVNKVIDGIGVIAEMIVICHA